MTAPPSTPTDQDPTAPEPSDGGRRRWPLVAGLIAVVLVVAVGFGVWYFVFRDTAPPEVDINRASESVEDKGGDAASSIDGTWTVDTSIGSFADFSSAFVGYRVNEELAGIGAKTAFGRTPDVSGSLTVTGTDVTAVEITADLTTLQSDEPSRDGQLGHQGIETDQFPEATFSLTEPIHLDEVPAEGETISVDGVGELTLHGVTREVTVPLEAKLVGEQIVVTGQIPILFADYGIEKPTSFKVLSIEDNGIMELQLFFTPRLTERDAVSSVVAKFVVVALVAAFIGGIVGWQIAQPETEDFNAVDIGFLADMTTHHQGALSLSFDYLGRESDTVVGHYAREIVREQSVEIATMNALLDDVGEPADAVIADDVAMEWMGEPVAPDKMPGLASAADYERLDAATGLVADDVFTELMIAHHAAGVAMADHEGERGENEIVRRLARGMAKVQRREIEELNARRAVLGLPEIEAAAAHH